MRHNRRSANMMRVYFKMESKDKNTEIVSICTTKEEIEKQFEYFLLACGNLQTSEQLELGNILHLPKNNGEDHAS